MVHRRELRALGVTKEDVRREVLAGRWRLAGRHTVVVSGGPVQGRGILWQAVWESGPGAVLDGAAALVAAGMTGYGLDGIDVSVPLGNHIHPLLGVRARRRTPAATVPVGIARVRPEWATLHAAQWAGSDRQAALLICLAVQQRLVAPDRLLAAWRTVRRSPRRAFLDAVLRDVCDGAHSLGELDFARWCRRRGLPEPTRQQVKTLRGGRVYLDVEWADVGLVVEIDGGHHALALNPVADALRQNEVTLTRRAVLRIPVVGLRLAPDAFLDQVARGLSLRAGAAAYGVA